MPAVFIIPELGLKDLICDPNAKYDKNKLIPGENLSLKLQI